jgi:hypothetical protein
MAQSGTFQLAPLPAAAAGGGFVPQRLGFAKMVSNANTSGGSSSSSGSDCYRLPLTRRSRLALPSNITNATTTTNNKLKDDKAVEKEAFMRLANGEIQGGYDFERLPDDDIDDLHTGEIRLVLSVGTTATSRPPAATSSTPTEDAAAAEEEQQQQPLQEEGTATTLLQVVLQGCTKLLRINGDGTKLEERVWLFSYNTKSYSERFSNALTLDERECLAHCVLHLFLRAGMASELPFGCLSDAVRALDHYYSKRNFMEQILDLYIIKADVGLATMIFAAEASAAPSAAPSAAAGAQKDHPPSNVFREAAASSKDDHHLSEMFDTLVLVGEYMESSAKVHQDHIEAGRVYEFITLWFVSKMSSGYLAMIHQYAGLAFRNGQDFNKAQEHLVAGWYALCSRSSSNSGFGRVVDINGEGATIIFTTFLVTYQMICEEKSRIPGAGRADGQRSVTAVERDAIVDIYPLLCGLLYLAGFQARQGGKSHDSVFQIGSQVAQMRFFRGGRLDQPSAPNILIQAGDRPDAHHFRQTILQSKGDALNGINTHFSGDRRRQPLSRK